MSDGTHISWSDATWNPVTGCTKVSAGCDHCYIDRTPPFRMQHRSFDKPGIGGTTGVQLHGDRLFQPLRWRKPRRIFVNSLSDLFHADIPDLFIASVFATMQRTPQHSYQVLSKRPARMRSLLTSRLFQSKVSWPLPNVWLGVSTEDQKAADLRIPILMDTPAAVRWISAEPLLGPISLVRTLGLQIEQHLGAAGVETSAGPWLDWVVAGGESGPGARPAHPDWFRTLRDQCAAAGVPFHFKQWGEWWPTGSLGTGVHLDSTPAGYLRQPVRQDPTHCYIGAPYTTHRTLSGAEIRMSPEMVRVGKKAAGRELDGVTHDAYPDTRPAVTL